MTWSARLEFAPIVTKDGRELVTLRDAGRHLETMPETEPVLLAVKEVMRAARFSNQITCHCARQAVSRAVHGDPKRPEPVARETWRDRRRERRSKVDRSR